MTNTKDSMTLYRPTLPYSIENSVRSVKHARLFLQEKVYLHHCRGLLSYLLLLSLLLYWVPLFSVRYLLPLFTACFFMSVIVPISLTRIIGIENIEITYVNAIVYLLLPIIYLGWLLKSSIIKQQLNNTAIAINGLFIGLLLILVSALYIIVISNLSSISRNNFQPPFTEAFYGIQILGLVAALLTTYVRSLPKTE